MEEKRKDRMIRGLVAGILGIINGILVVAFVILFFEGYRVELTVADKVLVFLAATGSGTWIWDSWLLRED